MKKGLPMTIRNSPARPPGFLSIEARRIWRDLTRDYSITDAAGKLLLQNALQAHDRMREAQAIIARDGPVIVDRFGIAKQHPATLVERDSRLQFMKAMQMLRLDVEPLRAGPGRPGGR